MTTSTLLRKAVWLFPAAEAVHAVEEHYQGHTFHVWLRELGRADFSPARTLLMHAAFVTVLLIVATVASRRHVTDWVAVALATVFLLNAVAHIVAAIAERSFLSGLVTSLFVWLPLAAYILVYAARTLAAARIRHAVVVGIAVQVAITWLAMYAT